MTTTQKLEMLWSVRPIELTAYLQSHAWKQIEQIEDMGAVWTKQAAQSEEFEILLPLDRTLSEYTRRVSEALHTLAVAERRDEMQVWRDITTTNSDIIRVRMEHGLIANGTLPFNYGVEMIQATHELLLAAACAAIRPRPHYASRKPQEALDYMNGLRLGQTEEGSFVLALQSPVPPALQHEALVADLLETRRTEPFERRVTLTLCEALAATYRAITAASASADFKPFIDAVASGVSANLCAALVGLSIDNTAEEVVLQISWSPTRQVTDKVPSRFRFGRDAFPVLREASRLLREQ